MLRLTNLSAPLDYTEESLRLLILQKLKLSPDQLLSFHLSRRSIDARNKSDVHFVLSVDLTLKNEQAALRHSKNLQRITIQEFQSTTICPSRRVWGGEPLTTASGGNLVRGEVNRNKQAPQCGVAPIEVAGRKAPQ